MLREAIEASRRVLGPEHPSTVSGMKLLAGFYLKQEGRKDEGLALLVEAVEADRSAGREDLSASTHLQLLATLMMEEERFEEAAELFEEALEVGRRNSHPGTDWVLSFLRISYASCLVQLERYDEAEAELLEVYGEVKTAAGKPGVTEKMLTRMALRGLEDLYTAWEKPEKAAEYLALRKAAMPGAKKD